jgi:hypothetical protein
LEKKRHVFEIQLNSITDTNNPTKKEVEFILHDFNLSHNYAFISKETAEKTLHTLKDMPIVAKYYKKSSYENNDDALGSHEMYLDTSRDTGEIIVAMDTIPIGVFTEDAYITTIKDNQGNDVEVVAGKGVLWASRFPNVVGLLKEWIDEGITVSSSMEILYDSYKVEEGITEILNFIYEGHCLLNSEERGIHSKVYPAYDVSRITKLVAQAVEQENQSEEVVVKMEEKELQQEEVVKEVETEVSEEVKEEELAQETTEETVEKVIEDPVQEVSEEVSEDTDEVKELQNQLSELQGKYELLKTEKEAIETKFNESTDKLTQLNSLVEELKPFKEQVETANFEKALNEKKEFYSKKFSALNAVEKFESEEVQGLVEKAVYENEEGKNAILQLNSLLVELVEVPATPVSENPTIREFSSKRENLIPASEDFESRYSL